MTRTVHVTTCRTCPFFRTHPLSAMLQLLVQTKSGFCGYDAERGTYDGELELGLPPGPKRDATMEKIHRANDRGHVQIDELPEKCPLRAGDITVTIAS